MDAAKKKSLYPATNFPSDIITLEQATAAGIPAFPQAEAFEVYPLVRMTWAEFVQRREAEFGALNGKCDA